MKVKHRFVIRAPATSLLEKLALEPGTTICHGLSFERMHGYLLKCWHHVDLVFLHGGFLYHVHDGHQNRGQNLAHVDLHLQVGPHVLPP